MSQLQNLFEALRIVEGHERAGQLSAARTLHSALHATGSVQLPIPMERFACGTRSRQGACSGCSGTLSRKPKTAMMRCFESCETSTLPLFWTPVQAPTKGAPAGPLNAIALVS